MTDDIAAAVKESSSGVAVQCQLRAGGKYSVKFCLTEEKPRLLDSSIIAGVIWEWYDCLSIFL